MGTGLFKMLLTIYSFPNHTYLIDMYKEGLICNKSQPTIKISIQSLYIVFHQ